MGTACPHWFIFVWKTNLQKPTGTIANKNFISEFYFYCSEFVLCCWHSQCSLSDVEPSVVVRQFFFKQIGSFSFHLIFPMSGLNVHDNIAHKILGLEFGLSANFLCGFFITKNVKIGKFWGFWPFSQNVFNGRHWNLVYRHIVGNFKCVWKITPVDQVSEWVIKFNSLSRTADSEVHIIHISRVIIACTLKSLSSPK